jgi:hypothetical protein
MSISSKKLIARHDYSFIFNTSRFNGILLTMFDSLTIFLQVFLSPFWLPSSHGACLGFVWPVLPTYLVKVNSPPFLEHEILSLLQYIYSLETMMLYQISAFECFLFGDLSPSEFYVLSVSRT